MFNAATRSEIREKIVFEMRKDNIKTKFEAKDAIINPVLVSLECIFHPRHHHLLSSFKMNLNDKESSVDAAIIKALLKSLKRRAVAVAADGRVRTPEELKHEEDYSLRSQIRLCLKWNRFDLASRFILTDENKDKVQQTTTKSHSFDSFLNCFVILSGRSARSTSSSTMRSRMANTSSSTSSSTGALCSATFSPIDASSNSTMT